MNHDDALALTQAVARTSAQLELLLWIAAAMCSAAVGLGVWLVRQQMSAAVERARIQNQLARLDDRVGALHAAPVLVMPHARSAGKA